MVFYCDTSALIKRYSIETGSRWLTNLCDPRNGNTIFTATITKVEAAAALASKRRQKSVSAQIYQQALADLSHDFVHEYALVPVDMPLIEAAVTLTTRQKLRGYDAVQLAAAQTIQSTLSAAQLPPLTFLTADVELLTAAINEGLMTDNPTLYP
jgi:predicted nucleic acid-binding protein